MKSKSKIYFAAAVLFALMSQSFFLGHAAAEPASTSDFVLQNGSFLTVSIPDRSRLNLVSVTVVIVDGDAVGVAAVYDDPATARPADYCELYDNSHELVGLGWVDRFGIERMALDRGLLENDDSLEGTFVVLSDGDSF